MLKKNKYEIKNPEYLDSMKSLYQQIRRYDSFEEADYKLSKLFGNEIPTIEIIRPSGWMDGGIDQEWYVGNAVVARLEYKFAVDSSSERFYWEDDKIFDIANLMERMASSCLIRNENDSICKEKIQDIRLKVNKDDEHIHSFMTNPGRGFTLGVIYPFNLLSQCVINFTGSKYIDKFIKKINKQIENKKPRKHIIKEFQKQLYDIGLLIQPCITQLVFSMLIEGYIRQDFKTQYKHLRGGIDSNFLRLSDQNDIGLVNYFKKFHNKNLEENRKRWLANLSYVLLSEVLHIDTLLNLNNQLKEKNIDPIEYNIFEDDYSILEINDISNSYVDFVRHIRNYSYEFGWLKFLSNLNSSIIKSGIREKV